MADKIMTTTEITNACLKLLNEKVGMLDPKLYERSAKQDINASIALEKNQTATAIMSKQEQADAFANSYFKARDQKDAMMYAMRYAMRYGTAIQQVTYSPDTDRIDILAGWLMPIAKETRLNKKLLLLL